MPITNPHPAHFSGAKLAMLRCWSPTSFSGLMMRSRYNRRKLPGPSFWYTNTGFWHFWQEISSNREYPPRALLYLSFLSLMMWGMVAVYHSGCHAELTCTTLYESSYNQLLSQKPSSTPPKSFGSMWILIIPSYTKGPNISIGLFFFSE